MRILVTTLHTGENEFEGCVASIRAQTLAPVEHLIIENLPKREAHEKLYGTFMQRRNEFDLLIKVDADMVLCSDDLFAEIAARFERDPDMWVLGIKVHDFYTDRLMSGLNTYRNTIAWSANGDMVFTDQFNLEPGRYVRDGQVLAPAAHHCPDPSPFQAFHFGVHRGVKAIVALQRRLYETAYMRYREVELTWRHFKRIRDPRLGLAVLGGEYALQGRFNDAQLDRDNPEVHAVFEEHCDADAARLDRQIRELRRGGSSRWPWWVRMEIRRGGFWMPLRCLVPIPLRKAVIVVAGSLSRCCRARLASYGGIWFLV